MSYVEILFLGVSIIILGKASELVVENISKLASYFRISSMAVGILLVAAATSLPELSVAISSASIGKGALTAGNVFGSNIANILLVFGLGAVLYKIKIPQKNIQDAGLILMLTTVISVYIIMNSIVYGKALGMLEGVILLGVFVVYSLRCVKIYEVPNNNDSKIKKKQALRAFGYFCIGILLVMISSELVVSNAVAVAKKLKIAESLIGATIIALGTSLPELTIGIQALRRKKYGIAVGDALGSNIINLTLVLGTGSLLSEIHVQLPIFIAALLFAIVANVLLMYLAAVKRSINLISGFILLILYIVFITAIISLQMNALSFAQQTLMI